MGRKAKVVDQDWAVELAGTPSEQWARAKHEIELARKKFEAVQKECHEIEEKAEDEADLIIGKAEDEADQLMTQTRKKINKILEKAEEEFEQVNNQYYDIKRSAEIEAKKAKEKHAKKRIRINTLREKVWTEPDIDKAIKIFNKVQKLQKELNEEESGKQP